MEMVAFGFIVFAVTVAQSLLTLCRSVGEIACLRPLVVIVKPESAANLNLTMRASSAAGGISALARSKNASSLSLPERTVVRLTVALRSWLAFTSTLDVATRDCWLLGRMVRCRFARLGTFRTNKPYDLRSFSRVLTSTSELGHVTSSYPFGLHYFVVTMAKRIQSNVRRHIAWHSQAHHNYAIMPFNARDRIDEIGMKLPHI